MNPPEYVRQFFHDPAMHSGVWVAHLANFKSIPNKVANAAEFAHLDYEYNTLDVSRGFITQAELVMIMKWKLMRGKMRPLLKQIEALTEEAVQTATRNGFEILKQSLDAEHIRKAVDAIAKPLKGVGPATASAVLAKYSSSLPFMSDAGLIAVNGNTDYTVKAYMAYYHGITAKCAQLNSDRQSKYLWTAKTVEAVLHLVYSRYDLKIPL